MSNLSVSISKSRAALTSAVYGRMSLGLLLTALTSVIVAAQPSWVEAIFGTNLFWAFIIGEFALVWFVSARIQKLEPSTSLGLFFLYSILNGVTLSFIFIAYQLGSIATTFFITTGMFGSMALYGYTTQRDLSGMGRIFMMGLIGIIIASLVNVFMESTMFEWIISFIGVIVFSGLAMYDSQRIRIAGEDLVSAPSGTRSRVSTILALSMYLNFINLFLFVLRFVGNRD